MIGRAGISGTGSMLKMGKIHCGPLIRHGMVAGQTKHTEHAGTRVVSKRQTVRAAEEAMVILPLGPGPPLFATVMGE